MCHGSSEILPISESTHSEDWTVRVADLSLQKLPHFIPSSFLIPICILYESLLWLVWYLNHPSFTLIYSFHRNHFCRTKYLLEINPQKSCCQCLWPLDTLLGKLISKTGFSLNYSKLYIKKLVIKLFPWNIISRVVS